MICVCVCVCVCWLSLLLWAPLAVLTRKKQSIVKLFYRRKLCPQSPEYLCALGYFNCVGVQAQVVFLKVLLSSGLLVDPGLQHAPFFADACLKTVFFIVCPFSALNGAEGGSVSYLVEMPLVVFQRICLCWQHEIIPLAPAVSCLQCVCVCVCLQGH